ncbi:hypothetical protein CC86DRAFT_385454 [Ophiobolus disseminans]|uniref:Uncharacterized protein n=1 Tax=Ophiobolus disseminans TaxID=1469910 RepID=A0A6A6ZNQ4_9PLEO|nr:hypothetical protein CC86DRAFT_385454 [Ophiobolus disseminans]
MLKGVPIITQLTEAEKDRAARPSEDGTAPGANARLFYGFAELVGGSFDNIQEQETIRFDSHSDRIGEVSGALIRVRLQLNPNDWNSSDLHPSWPSYDRGFDQGCGSRPRPYTRDAARVESQRRVGFGEEACEMTQHCHSTAGHMAPAPGLFSATADTLHQTACGLEWAFRSSRQQVTRPTSLIEHHLTIPHDADHVGSLPQGQRDHCECTGHDGGIQAMVGGETPLTRCINHSQTNRFLGIFESAPWAVSPLRSARPLRVRRPRRWHPSHGRWGDTADTLHQSHANVNVPDTRVGDMAFRESKSSNIGCEHVHIVSTIGFQHDLQRVRIQQHRLVDVDPAAYIGAMTGVNGNGPMAVPSRRNGHGHEGNMRSMGFGSARSPPNNKSAYRAHILRAVFTAQKTRRPATSASAVVSTAQKTRHAAGKVVESPWIVGNLLD